jgi:Pyruvate flavodoxin/ferredoxin oxidoreductase, thiamine diP-bdg
MSAEKIKLVPFTGDQAAAYAMKQIEPDVVAAYPITPQTEIVCRRRQDKNGDDTGRVGTQRDERLCRRGVRRRQDDDSYIR